MQQAKKVMSPPGNPYRVQLRTLKKILEQKKTDERFFGIEYYFLVFICAGLMAMPAMAVRAAAGKYGYTSRKLAVEAYAIGKPIVLGLVLLLAPITSLCCAIVAAICIADLYLYLSGLIFLRRFYTPPASPSRSLLLLAVNFFEALLAFAIFYGNSQSISFSSGNSVPISDPLTLLYFSCVTAATVGYGDVVPFTSIGRSLVIMQILSSVGFVSIFVATFVTNLNVQEK